MYFFFVYTQNGYVWKESQETGDIDCLQKMKLVGDRVGINPPVAFDFKSVKS